VTGRLKIYFDGGARPNPGQIEVAVVARGVTHLFDGLGCGTSHDAEWLALIAAITLAEQLGTPDFELIGDSVPVIQQATGLRPCRSASAQAHRDRFAALVARTPPARIRWIKRTQNLAGIALAARHGR
jgi:ribonuclease HI